MKNILMVTKDPLPPIGGTGRHVLEISKLLEKRGYSVTILCPFSESQVLRDSSKIQLIALKSIGREPVELSFQLLRLSRFFDLIHFHTFSILCRTLRFGISKIPYFITTHGIASSSQRFPRFYDLYKKYIIRENFLKATRVFCTSYNDLQIVRGIVSEETDHKPLYLQNATDPSYLVGNNKTEAKKRLGWSDHIVLTTIARFVYHKGQHILLKSIHKLLKSEYLKKNKLLVVLAGKTYDKEYYLRMLKLQEKLGITDAKFVKTVFAPNLSDDSIRRIYGATDIFVISSLREGLPLTLFEAWGAKCAVIASDVGGIPHVAKHGYNSLLYPAGDSTRLAENIITLLKDYKTAKRLGENGHSKVLEKYTWDKIVDNLELVYNKL